MTTNSGQTTELTVGVWANPLREELSGIVTERVKVAREEILRMHWEVGQTMRKYEKDTSTKVTALVQWAIGEHLMSERDLWYSIKFYDAFKDFELVYDTPEGQNISWSKVKRSVLAAKEDGTTPALPATCEHAQTRRTTVCCSCGKEC